MTNPKNNLTEKQQGILTKLGLRKAKKLMSESTKLYNQLCGKCRYKVMGNPNMSINNYCKRCRQKAKVLEDIANE